MAKRVKDLVIMVLRDETGKVYSEIRDRKMEELPRIDANGFLKHPAVVIDRQRGRGLDLETISNRARYLSELLEIPYEEHLEYVCLATRGLYCSCPKCVEHTQQARR